MKEDTFKYKNSINVNNINTILNYINREMGTSIISKNLLTKILPIKSYLKNICVLSLEYTILTSKID